MLRSILKYTVINGIVDIIQIKIITLKCNPVEYKKI